MQIRNLALIGLLFLVGCGTTEPLLKVETREVKVPVPVACKTPEPAVPDYNVPKLTTNSTIYQKTKAYLADEQLRKGYEKELLAALKSCK